MILLQNLKKDHISANFTDLQKLNYNYCNENVNIKKLINIHISEYSEKR